MPRFICTLAFFAITFAFVFGKHEYPGSLCGLIGMPTNLDCWRNVTVDNEKEKQFLRTCSGYEPYVVPDLGQLGMYAPYNHTALDYIKSISLNITKIHLFHIDDPNQLKSEYRPYAVRLFALDAAIAHPIAPSTPEQYFLLRGMVLAVCMDLYKIIAASEHHK